MTIMTTDATGPVGSAMSSPGRLDRRDEAASRALIVGSLVVVVSWIVAVAVFRSPDFAGKTALSSVRLLLAAAAVAAAVAAVMGLLLRRSESPRFLVREGAAFVLPPSRALGYLIVTQVLGFGLATTFAIDESAAPRDGDPVHAVIKVAFAVSAWVMAVLIGGLTAVMVVFALSERSLVKITPSAVVWPGVIRSRTIPWAALRPEAWPELDSASRTIALTIDRPELVVPPLSRGPAGIPRPMTVSFVYTSGHPGFLANAIRFYTAHPDRRDAIGTRAEYERLLANLNVPASTG